MTTQLMTSTDPLMPENSTNDLNQVIWQGDKNMPTYTITLINNTNHTVYPFLYTTNDAAACSTKDFNNNYVCSNYANDPANNPGSIYDPKDPYLHDYRGYIGYTGQDGKNYLGLPTGQTATITVPLVFWDAARIFVTSDSTYLIPPPGTQYQQANPPINPYQFYWVNQNGSLTLRCQQAMKNLQPTSPGLNPVVLWYHADVAPVPANDAPARLLEFTMRHPWQYNYNSYLDKNTLGPLINYDVSYVDTIYLPVAMEADQFTDGQPAYGWIGASQTEEAFQQAFQNFTSSNPAQNGLTILWRQRLHSILFPHHDAAWCRYQATLWRTSHWKQPILFSSVEL